MSVQFDATSEEQAIHANDPSELAPTLPFSVSLWVYFESIPDEGTQIIWWYGDKDSASDYVRLELDNANQKFQITAGSAYASISAVVCPNAISPGSWHLVTFVAEYDSDIDQLTHRLFVDDQNAASQSATVTDPSASAWDRFTLGRRGTSLGFGGRLPATCLVEQAAIWSAALDREDHHLEMWSSTDEDFDGLPRARIDACVNSSIKYPLSPTFAGVGFQRRDQTNGDLLFELSFEDMVQTLFYAWRRGMNEARLWVYSGGTDVDEGTEEDLNFPSDVADFDKTYRACRWVSDTIETMTYYSRDRTCRHCRVWR